MSLTAQINGVKQFQPLPVNVPGSPASFGSFGENAALGSSFGSIGEISSMSMPLGVNGHTSLGAGSPDARWHHMQFMQNAGQTQLGMNPSAAGMRPSLSLGVSPSHQFHVPGPHFQASPGSQHISSPGSQYVVSPFQSSPGSSFRGPGSPSQGSPRYGPTSPAYAGREFNKQRRNPGPAPVPSLLNGSGAVPYDNVLFSRLHQNNATGNTDVGGGNFGHMHGSPHMGPQWRTRAASNMGMFDQHHLNNIYLSGGTLGPLLFTSETTTEAGDEEVAGGSGEWDGDFR